MSIRGIRVLFVLVLILAVASIASAQATRTWVSGVGDDANPCSRTAPCKTFAGAISKTAAAGEISVLDPGGFGAVTITKSITINGQGTLAGILSSITNGVIINAGVNDVIILRDISINGAGNGLDGIRFLAGRLLVVDHCWIYGVTGDGLEINTATNGSITQLDDVNFVNCATGVRVTHQTVGQRASLNWHGGNIANCPLGIVATTRSNVVLREVNVAGSSNIGIQADGSTTEVHMDGMQITQNNVGVQTINGGTVRFSNCGFFTNGKAIDNQGTAVSFVTNRFGGNPNANTGNAIGTQVQQ